MDRITAMRAYTRVVELGSFTAVAHELRVKQSTVSKWLASLEEEVGVQLIERTTRTQRVTTAGHRFYQRALSLVGAYDDALSEVRQEASELRGRVRMSVPVVFGRLFITDPVARFVEQNAKVEVELFQSDAYEDLLMERLDLAVRVGVPIDSTYRARGLGRSDRCLVASPKYIETHGAPSTAQALQHHSCLVHSGPTTSSLWRLQEGSRTARIPVTGPLRSNNALTLRDWALAGHGIAMLARWLVYEELQQGTLVAVLPDLELPPVIVQALTPPLRHPRPVVQALIESLAVSLRPVFSALRS